MRCRSGRTGRSQKRFKQGAATAYTSSVEAAIKENDSIYGIEVKERMAELEIKQETEKKQHQIELLIQENNTKIQKIKTRNLFIISFTLHDRINPVKE